MCYGGFGVKREDGSIQRGPFGQLFNTPDSRLNIIGDKSSGEGGKSKGSDLYAQIKTAPKKESTPSLPKSSGDSGLSIRRSSRSSSNTSNRRGGSSRAGARKRYKTT